MALADTTINALIAAGGLIVGAVVTAIASGFAARSKIAELETTYRQKLRDSYLENARKYTDGVYVPIGVLITTLEKEYRAFKTAMAKSTESSPTPFKSVCESYLVAMDDLFSRGADAFLTVELEARVAQFNSFLRESVDAVDSVRSVVVQLAGGWMFGGWSPRYKFARVRGGWARLLDLDISMAGVRLAYSNELLAAPLGSEDFAKAFAIQVGTMRSLLKEVTLGTHTDIAPSSRRA